MADEGKKISDLTLVTLESGMQVEVYNPDDETAEVRAALGTAASKDVGTSANNVVQLDASAKLPAVDGSQLTNLPGTSGDLADLDVTGVILEPDDEDETIDDTTGADVTVLIDGVLTDDRVVSIDSDFLPASGRKLVKVLHKASSASTLGYDNLSGTFTVGETITGGTSEATATILADSGSVLALGSVNGTFQNDEEITGGTSGATADVDGTLVTTNSFTVEVDDEGASEIVTLSMGEEAEIVVTSGGCTLARHGPIEAGDLAAKDAVGAGDLDSGLISGQTELTEVNDNDLVLVEQASSGDYKKVKKSNLVGTVEATLPEPDTVEITGATHTLDDADDEQVYDSILLVVAPENGSDNCAITIPKAAAKNSVWRIHSNTSGTTTVAVEDNAGSVNGSSGGSVTMTGVGKEITVTVISNAGAAPVVSVKGDTNEATTAVADHNHADKVLSRPELKDYAETVDAATSSSNTLTLDLESANVFTCTLAENTTVAFSNPPTSGKAGSATLILTQDGSGNHTVTWPASVKWAGGTAPSISTAANAIDVFTFITVDGGTSWLGMTGGIAFATPA